MQVTMLGLLAKGNAGNSSKIASSSPRIGYRDISQLLTYLQRILTIKEQIWKTV